MALTKPVPQNPAATQPAAAPAAPVKSVGTFEAMEESTTSQEPANDPAPPSAEAPAAAPVPAVQSGGAVVKSSRAEASALAKEVADMKGAADFSYGNYSVFKGNNGTIVQTGGGTGDLGRWVKVSMIAWDEHWELSPNVTGDKAKNAVGYSKDGVTVDSIIGSEYGGWVGKRVDDYLDFLRSEGDYPEAKSSRYVDIACVVHDAEKDKTFAGEIVQITLSSSSIPSFSAYQQSLEMKSKAMARGIPGITLPEDPFTFYFVCELAQNKGNKWTKLKLVTKLPT